MTVAVDWDVKPQHKQTKTSCNKTGHSVIIQFPPFNHKLKKHHLPECLKCKFWTWNLFWPRKLTIWVQETIMYRTKLAHRQCLVSYYGNSPLTQRCKGPVIIYQLCVCVWGGWAIFWETRHFFGDHPPCQIFISQSTPPPNNRRFVMLTPSVAPPHCSTNKSLH